MTISLSPWSVMKKVYGPAGNRQRRLEQTSQRLQKDYGADEAGRAAGQQHRTRGNIQTSRGAFARRLVQAVEEGLHGTIEELRRQNEADATQQQTPFQPLAAQHHSGGEDQGREKEMDEETGVAADA